MTRLSPNDIALHKGPQIEPLVCLTAYTYPMAQILDAHCDVLLVGDSLGMVLYGMRTTLGVDMDMMIRHGRAVTEASENACVVIDMPYGTYEKNFAAAYANICRMLAMTGAGAVKLEGGEDMAPLIEHLTMRGIDVMAHIGLQPQSVEKDGGYKIKGKTQEQEEQLMRDAMAVQEAGAFSVVIEGTIEPVARKISAALKIPTIGIGASAACDGQILVTEDMLGLMPGVPTFVKQYEDMRGRIETAVETYKHEVKTRAFPDAQSVYTAPNAKPETPYAVKRKAS